MCEIRRLDPEEWRLWRELRLVALADAPDAFGGNYAHSRAQSDEWWKERAGGHCWVASEDGRFVGMAQWFLLEDDKPLLISMYVRAEARGRGIGELLIEAICREARAQGYSHLHLGVTEGSPARRLYERCGFVTTGERYSLREGSSLNAEKMVKELTD